MGVLRGCITIATMIAFFGVCWWAYRPGGKERFEADALLPFDDDESVRGRSSGERER